MSEKKTVSQFEGSKSGLYSVSFDEGVPAGSWKRRLHYVPLATLLADACVATGVSTWYKAIHPAPQVPTPATQASSFTHTASQSPSEVCAPTPRTDVGPWMPGVAGTAGYLSTDVAQVLFKQSMTGVITYAQGRDGYLSLSSVFDMNFSQALGRVHPTPEQVSAWDRYMSGVETAANEQDVTALSMPVSATWGVYSDKLPQWTDPLMGMTPLDLMRSVLPIRVQVDVREDLHEAREGGEVPLYPAVNPHWSPYTAHVAWNRTLSCLAAASPQLEGPSSLTPSGMSSVDASNEHEALGAPAQSGSWVALTHEQDPGNVHLLQLETYGDLADIAAHLAEITGTSEVSLVNPVDFQNKSAFTYNPNGRGTVLIVRDSQGNNLRPKVIATFEYIIQVDHGLDTEQPTDVATLIEVYKLSVMIVEFTLHYLVFAPAAGKQDRFPDYDRSDGNSRV